MMESQIGIKKISIINDDGTSSEIASGTINANIKSLEDDWDLFKQSLQTGLEKSFYFTLKKIRYRRKKKNSRWILTKTYVTAATILDFLDPLYLNPRKKKSPKGLFIKVGRKHKCQIRH